MTTKGSKQTSAFKGSYASFTTVPKNCSLSIKNHPLFTHANTVAFYTMQMIYASGYDIPSIVCNKISKVEEKMSKKFASLVKTTNKLNIDICNNLTDIEQIKKSEKILICIIRDAIILYYIRLNHFPEQRTKRSTHSDQFMDMYCKNIEAINTSTHTKCILSDLIMCFIVFIGTDNLHNYISQVTKSIILEKIDKERIKRLEAIQEKHKVESSFIKKLSQFTNTLDLEALFMSYIYTGTLEVKTYLAHSATNYVLDPPYVLGCLISIIENVKFMFGFRNTFMSIIIKKIFSFIIKKIKSVIEPPSESTKTRAHKTTHPKSVLYLSKINKYKDHLHKIIKEFLENIFLYILKGDGHKLVKGIHIFLNQINIDVTLNIAHYAIMFILTDIDKISKIACSPIDVFSRIHIQKDTKRLSVFQSIVLSIILELERLEGISTHQCNNKADNQCNYVKNEISLDSKIEDELSLILTKQLINSPQIVEESEDNSVANERTEKNTIPNISVQSRSKYQQKTITNRLTRPQNTSLTRPQNTSLTRPQNTSLTRQKTQVQTLANSSIPQITTTMTQSKSIGSIGFNQGSHSIETSRTTLNDSTNFDGVQSVVIGTQLPTRSASSVVQNTVQGKEKGTRRRTRTATVSRVSMK